MAWGKQSLPQALLPSAPLLFLPVAAAALETLLGILKVFQASLGKFENIDVRD